MRTIVTLHEIIEATAQHFDLPPEAISDPDCRRLEVTYARHVAQFIARKLTLQSTTQISQAFGQLDHSTVLKAVNRITNDGAGAMADVTAVEALVERNRKLGPPDRRGT